MAKSFKGKVVKGKYWDLFFKIYNRKNSDKNVQNTKNELFDNLFSGKYKLDLKK